MAGDYVAHDGRPRVDCCPRRASCHRANGGRHDLRHRRRRRQLAAAIGGTTVVRQFLAMSIAAVAVASPALPDRQQASSQPTRPPEAASATLADRTDLSLTIYNSDLALVRDVRQVSLPAGTVSLRFADVATAVNPATVR